MAGAMGGTTGPPAGVGTVVEVVEDRLFGPLIAFGAGGPAAELPGDRAFRSLPLTDVDPAALVRTGPVVRLLAGVSGAPPANLAALEELRSAWPSWPTPFPRSPRWCSTRSWPGRKLQRPRAFGSDWRPGRPARSKDCAGFARPVQLSAASTDSRSPGNAAVNVTRSPVAGCSKDSRRACSHTRPRANRGRPAGH